MDKIKRYAPEDFIEIMSWYEKRGTKFDDYNLLPSVGFVVPGVGAGFIYMTDRPVAFIEGYITNPDASSNNRSEALDAITFHLLCHARTHGCKIVKCETIHNDIASRGMNNHGFKVLGKVTSLVKEL